MTDTTEQAVTVAQIDREAAQIIANLGPDILRGINREKFARLLALHRTNPEPVPATNQAGEVEAIKAAIIKRADECQRHAEASFYPQASSEYRAKETAFREAANLCTTALATQPATSQEGEGTLANPSTYGKPTFGLTATPTPPTLSEDLREERYTEDSVRARLRGTIEGQTLPQWCKANEVNPTHAYEFANGKRNAPVDLLAAMGLARMIVVAHPAARAQVKAS